MRLCKASTCPMKRSMEACSEVGDVCEWGKGNYGAAFCGRGHLSGMFTPDEGCPMNSQNLNEIGQSVAKLQQFKLLHLAAVRYFGFSRKACLNHSTHCRIPLSMHTINLVQISQLAAKICAQNGFRKKFPLAAEFYFRFQGWRRPSLRDIRICHRAKFQPNRTIGSRVMAM